MEFKCNDGKDDGDYSLYNCIMRIPKHMDKKSAEGAYANLIKGVGYLTLYADWCKHCKDLSKKIGGFHQRDGFVFLEQKEASNIDKKIRVPQCSAFPTVLYFDGSRFNKSSPSELISAISK